MKQQQNLFDQSLADTLSRDAAMERGLLVQLDDVRWVRIDRRGVYSLVKHVQPEGVMTREERISPLPMLPLAVFDLKGEHFVQVLYGTQHHAVRLENLRMEVVISPERHKRAIQDLAVRGFLLTATQWNDLSVTLRQVIARLNVEDTLPVHEVSARDWYVQKDCLVPRPQEWKVIAGGRVQPVQKTTHQNGLRAV